MRIFAPWAFFSVALSAAVVARAEKAARTITRIEVEVDRPRQGEREELGRYLSDLHGAPASEETAARGEALLLRLDRYRSAVCRVGPRGEGARLKCGLSRARSIRSVRVEGLPWQLLETDLRRRVFLRSGEVLDRQDASGKDRVTRQRERLEEYLERQGYYGAVVEVLTPPVSRSADVDVLIRIRGGSFVRVRRVFVTDWLPLDKATLERRFGGLCTSLDGLLDTGELACFTQERLRDVKERFEEEMRRAGFPEGRLSVEQRFVDPKAKATATGGCFAGRDEITRYESTGLPVPPRCVDLVVRVRPGPRLVPRVLLHGPGEAEAAGRPHDAFQQAREEAERVLGELGGDFVSRLLQWGFSQPLPSANDTELRRTELLRTLTFTASRATDETEAELSRRALEEALARRGYFNARVELDWQQVGPERVEALYRVHPGPPLALGAVRLVGNEAFSEEQLREEVELAARPRTWRDDGFVTRGDLDDDVARLRSFYERRGWRDANVSWRVIQVSDGRMDVVFTIDEGKERYLIAGVRLVGGVDELAHEVLGVLEHCKQGRAARAREPPKEGADCALNPLLPDELEADMQRVLNVYASFGYPYASARVQISQEWTAEGPFVEVEVWQGERAAPGADAAPGPAPVRVQRGVVFLEGNHKTDRGVLLKEMGLSDTFGELLDPIAISKGVSRLRRTGLFSRVGFDYVGVEEQSDRVHLLVQLEERPTLTLDTSLGFSTDNLWVLRTELRDRNFLGRMLDMSALIDLGLFIGRFSQAQLRGRWPRILGSSFDLTLQPGVVYSDVPSATVPRSPDEDGPLGAVAAWDAPDLRRRIFSLGVSASLDWRAPPELLPGLVASLGYEFGLRYDNPNALRVPLFSERALGTLDGLLEAFDVPPQRFGLISPRVAYSSVTNPFDPDEGWAGELALRIGSPLLGGAESFILATGRATGYLPLSNEAVLAMHGRGWWGASDLEGTGTSLLLSPELLILGGDRTVRGFNPSGFGSSNRPFGLVALPSLLASGEDSRDSLALFGVQVNLELRQTLLKDFLLGDVKGALFLDAGFVTDDFSLPWLDPIALYQQAVLLPLREQRETLFGASLGVGLRYVLPVGPMSLDVAFSPTHQLFGVHFQFGYAF